MTPTSSEGGGGGDSNTTTECMYVLIFSGTTINTYKSSIKFTVYKKKVVIGSEPGSKSRLAKTVIFTSISIKNITQYSHLHCPTVDHHDD